MDKHIEIWNIARELKLDHRFYEGLDTLLTKIESDNKQLILQNVNVPQGTVCLRANCKQHTADDKCNKGDDYDCLYRQTAR